MQVKLMSHTPDPDMVVASAARLCYSKDNPMNVYKLMTKEQCESLISRVYSMGHTSTFEHATFTFAISGVSRVLSHQLVRHRIASYSQRSQRYVDEGECDVVIPTSVKKNDIALKLFNDIIRDVNFTYARLKELGVPNEDARYVLMNATQTHIIVTMNARELLNFFKERLCERAQWEIRRMAQLMLEEVREVAPLLFKTAGPTCITEGICHQGKLRCKPLEEIWSRPANCKVECKHVTCCFGCILQKDCARACICKCEDRYNRDES